MWSELIDSAEMHDYWGFSSNAISGPLWDDWPAVRTLRDRRLLSDDAVFVPGHTGDFLSGSHLRYLFDPLWHADPHDFSSAMVKKHYSLWEDLVDLGEVREAIDRRLYEVLGGFPRDTEADLARMYEFWEWRERQSKYIINSVRVYEFFGYNWRIPLWDREIMDFWKPIPVLLKMEKYLYRKYLATQDWSRLFEDEQAPVIWDREQVAGRLSRSRRRRIRSGVQRVPLLSTMLWRYDRYKKHRRDYRIQSLGLSEIYGKLRYTLMEPAKRHAEAPILREFLRYQYGLDIRKALRNWAQS